ADMAAGAAVVRIAGQAVAADARPTATHLIVAAILVDLAGATWRAVSALTALAGATHSARSAIRHAGRDAAFYRIADVLGAGVAVVALVAACQAVIHGIERRLTAVARIAVAVA